MMFTIKQDWKTRTVQDAASHSNVTHHYCFHDSPHDMQPVQQLLFAAAVGQHKVDSKNLRIKGA